MMHSDAWLIVGSLAGLAGVAVLRASWSRQTRSRGMNAAGWLLIAGGVLCGAVVAGSWGIATGSLLPMASALAFLAIAAVRSMPGKLHASNQRAQFIPVSGQPLRLAGRCLTFLLVAVGAALIGLGLAVSAGGLALLSGAGKADAYATALFTMPIAWSALAFALLMQPRRRGQFKVLAMAGIPIVPCLAAGLLS